MTEPLQSADPVSAPANTLTPFGFSVYPDGAAVITLAHSGHDRLFRDGAFKSISVSGGQAGNCWTTRVGKYVFIVNTGSKTISRVLGTGTNVFVDSAVAATVTAGGSPTDTMQEAVTLLSLTILRAPARIPITFFPTTYFELTAS